jgi:hypothetical protein
VVAVPTAAVPEALGVVELSPVMLLKEVPVIAPAAKFPEASLSTIVETVFEAVALVAIAIESAVASPVIVIPVPAVKVRVSVDESATGLVPDGVEIVANELEAEPPPTKLVLTPAPPPVMSM